MLLEAKAGDERVEIRRVEESLLDLAVRSRMAVPEEKEEMVRGRVAEHLRRAPSILKGGHEAKRATQRNTIDNGAKKGISKQMKGLENSWSCVSLEDDA